MIQLTKIALLVVAWFSRGSQAFADLAEDLIEDSTEPEASPKSSGGPHVGLKQDDSVSSRQEKTHGQKPKSEAQAPGASSKPSSDHRATGEQKKPDKTDRNRNADAPIKFSSKELTGERDGGTVMLEEDVVVIQDDLRISADKATLKFDKLSNDVVEVVATGNVMFTRKDPETGLPVKADSREAVFNNTLRTVVLKGDPRMVRGTDVVRGKIITYDLTTGWVKATRVEGVVQPTKNGDLKKAAPSTPAPQVAPAATGTKTPPVEVGQDVN
ncbi:MAG: hypothetical protein NTV34_00530 [Proteobacteria bacterium]|nr:hypothetical protein [Pseudomonadota bacterium]